MPESGSASSINLGNVRKTRLHGNTLDAEEMRRETKVSFSDAAERVRAATTRFYTDSVYRREKDHIVRLKHKVCGQTFDWELGRFRKDRPAWYVKDAVLQENQ